MCIKQKFAFDKEEKDKYYSEPTVPVEGKVLIGNSFHPELDTDLLDTFLRTVDSPLLYERFGEGNRQ